MYLILGFTLSTAPSEALFLGFTVGDQVFLSWKSLEKIWEMGLKSMRLDVECSMRKHYAYMCKVAAIILASMKEKIFY